MKSVLLAAKRLAEGCAAESQPSWHPSSGYENCNGNLGYRDIWQGAARMIRDLRRKSVPKGSKWDVNRIDSMIISECFRSLQQFFLNGIRGKIQYPDTVNQIVLMMVRRELFPRRRRWGFICFY